MELLFVQQILTFKLKFYELECKPQNSNTRSRKKVKLSEGFALISSLDRMWLGDLSKSPWPMQCLHTELQFFLFLI